MLSTAIQYVVPAVTVGWTWAWPLAQTLASDATGVSASRLEPVYTARSVRKSLPVVDMVSGPEV